MKMLIFLLPFLVTTLGWTAEIFVVAPNALDHTDGNTAQWPFTFEELGINSRRYQQVYDASQFGAIAPEGAYITQLYFREGGDGPGDTSEYLPNVQIDLGTTSRGPDSLSPVFAENVGSIPTTVYSSSLQIWTAQAAPWTIVQLSTPFFYSPRDGNLLLDIRTFASGGPTNSLNDLPALDAQEITGDSLSSVSANDVNASSGIVATSGLVTGFLAEPVPEPEIVALLLVGLAGVRWFRMRTK